MTPKSICLWAAVLVGAMAHTGPAFAQAADPANDTAVLSSSSSTSTTTIVGGVILTIVLSSGNSSLESYLRNNRVALRDDITHGGGATVADLADAFRVEDERIDEFGTLLRTHRRALLGLIDDDLDAARARRFVELIVEAGTREELVDPDRFAEG